MRNIRWEWLILGIVVGLLFASQIVVFEAVTRNQLRGTERPHAERNEWGQIVRPLSYQCVATILRWSKNCGYEWVDSQQERDDAKEE